ncbi:helix-turn-helix transcriptional regulator [Spelaeicoccus albus]|uniref:Putative ArsR family transcriptional regulator n=1 Tax=Spelaeicoccus albus TaxID=1280376 RepID=A0A7Z0IHK7_9MICO|nr:helix-turn-helix domain-containing protein [Spelaeicoccus albus]NYI67774.1 putative ArsR family transcriptional regulator [Spelaeicoccus albus]
MTDDRTATSDDVSLIGELAEPTRRAVYEFVAAGDDWVSRDGVAAAVGLGRAAVARHLDRLVDVGLLDQRSKRLTDRTGPGAGRPSKQYRRSSREVGASLPARDYELAGELLARAVDDVTRSGKNLQTALDDEARALGTQLAGEMRGADGGEFARTADGTGRVRKMLAVLSDHGYEPVQVGEDEIQLRNCPFHRLARAHPELVCGLNDALLESAVDGYGNTGYRARFEPEAGLCCVRLRRQSSSGRSTGR